MGEDAFWYRSVALELKDGGGYVEPRVLALHGDRVPTATFPPAYPVFVAVGSAFAGESRLAQQLLMTLVGTGTVVLVGLLGRRVGGPRVGILAAGIAALYPMLFLSEGALMPESLYVLLLTAALLLAYRAFDDPNIARWSALGACVGVATLTRSEGLFLIPLVVVPSALGVVGVSRLRRFALAGVAALVAVMVLAPWTMRNMTAFDQPVLLSNNFGATVAGANCPATYFGSRMGFWNFGCLISSALPRGADEAETSAALRREGTDYAWSQKGRVPIVSLVRLGRTWGFFDPVNQMRWEAEEGRPYGWQFAGWIMYLLLVPLSVLGASWLVRRRAYVRPLLGAVAAVCVSTILAYGNQRFRISAEPVVVVAASVSIIGLLDRHRAPTTG